MGSAFKGDGSGRESEGRGWVKYSYVLDTLMPFL